MFIFQGYYNNPEATAETFMEDKWIKSGDLFYRDENWNYFFVDRLKMLLKYRNHQVIFISILTYRGKICIFVFLYVLK